MRVYYYQDSYGNFGDELNQWLWPRVLPRGFDRSDNALLLGIGTLIRQEVPETAIKVVMGAGAGYGELPQLDERWRFYAVRGPRTAAALGLPAELAMTDTAALVNALEPLAGGRAGVGFMPHHVSRDLYDWASLSRRLGLVYLDPRAPVPRLLARMKRLKLVLAEAMHGAIVADALRVPWVPVRAYDHINSFKWHDWADSLELSYEPVDLPALADNHQLHPARRLNDYAKQAWRRKSLTRLGAPKRQVPSTQAEIDHASATLAGLAREEHGRLSEDSVLADRVRRLQDALARVSADWCGPAA
ncbi:MAG TPA: hypothetical protein VFS94_09565 [Gemmatimonadales bacterium]|nr:hypothetical protein [Gemmatimonadales bacterium]